ncbi:MAG: hypothetical protein M1387_06835 [Thaumarchaeota archaeon]|nr:hypothetical protein [Nitrososphaerota archaeon]
MDLPREYEDDVTAWRRLMEWGGEECGRRLAIRYERQASTFQVLINMARFVIHWRVLK